MRLTREMLLRKNHLLSSKLCGAHLALKKAREGRDSWKRRAEIAEARLLIINAESK